MCTTFHSKVHIFTGPRSDQSLPMSVTNWLTNWRTCWRFNELTFADGTKYLSDVDIEMKLRFSCQQLVTSGKAGKIVFFWVRIYQNGEAVEIFGWLCLLGLLMAFYSFVISLFGLVGLPKFVLLLFMVLMSLENVLELKGILRQAALCHWHLRPSLCCCIRLLRACVTGSSGR